MRRDVPAPVVQKPFVAGALAPLVIDSHSSCLQPTINERMILVFLCAPPRNVIDKNREQVGIHCHEQLRSAFLFVIELHSPLHPRCAERETQPDISRCRFNFQSIGLFRGELIN